MRKSDFSHKTAGRGWGSISEEGVEMWDAKPLFLSGSLSLKDRLMLFLYPKKFFLYRYINKAKKQAAKTRNLLTEPFRVLDLGCGTGGATIDLKRLLGREAELVGLDVVNLQVDLAKEQAKRHGVHAEFFHYEGRQFPFSSSTFDALYTSDVLGHVENVPFWLDEINRVLRPNGVLAMFAESKLGRHAYLRNFFMKQGLNTDPHAEFHISLFSKAELLRMLSQAGFDIERVYASVWAKFFVHPDELYSAFQKHKSWKILLFKWANALLYHLKKRTHPFSTALCELYSFFEMITLGRWLESQGYVILGKKK